MLFAPAPSTPILIGLALLIAIPSLVFAQEKEADWTLYHESKPLHLINDIYYVKKSIAHSDAPIKSSKSLHLIFFTTDTTTLKVVDPGDDPQKPRYRNLADAMQRQFCIAGCNGGYFSPEFQPSGLMIADGVHVGSFETKSSLLTGTLVVDSEHGPRILWKNEVSPEDPSITQLLQAGPRLVIDGRPNTVYRKSPDRNRTFIICNKDNQWAIGLCTNITLHDLPLILANREIMHELEVWRALNLDGGTSSSLYFSRGAGNRPFYFSGFKRVVRNYLGLVPR